jgi:GTP cyclohydrolase I
MKDIQSLHDSRRINIRKVGVKSISYPIIVLDKANKTQSTLALVNMSVNLPHRFKGTHMSRFVEILNCFHGQFNLKTFQRILEEMKARLEAEAAHLEIEFPYFLTKPAEQHSTQIPGAPELARYDCRLHGSLAQSFDLVVTVDIPIPLTQVAPQGTSMCAGLWGTITVAVRMHHFLWIEDLISLIEQGISSQSVRAESVESMCRRIEARLQTSASFDWYKIVVKKRVTGYATFASCEWPAPPTSAQEQSVAPKLEHTCSLFRNPSPKLSQHPSPQHPSPNIHSQMSDSHE